MAVVSHGNRLQTKVHHVFQYLLVNLTPSFSELTTQLVHRNFGDTLFHKN
jgi:hypothetical protein